MIKDVKKIIKETVQEVLPQLLTQRQKDKPWNAYKKTEARLYAYPVLKDNVEHVYPDDIADLQREGVSGKSKDIVMWSCHGGDQTITPAERQEAKILAVRIKLERDRESLVELDRALSYVKNEPDYMVLENYYFHQIGLDALAEDLNCSAQTVQRMKTRLVRQVSLRLYGAETFED